jgi:hypothetical protein
MLSGIGVSSATISTAVVGVGSGESATGVANGDAGLSVDVVAVGSGVATAVVGLGVGALVCAVGTGVLQPAIRTSAIARLAANAVLSGLMLASLSLIDWAYLQEEYSIN